MVQAAALLCLFLTLPQDEKPDGARLNRLIDQLGADFLEDRESALKALREVGPAAAPALVSALGRPDFRVRKACVELLTVLRDAAAVDRVGEVFRTDEDASVRDAAFAFLEAVGRPAEKHLVEALRSEKAEHRRGAARILTDLRSEGCAGAMNALYENDPDKAVRDQALEYLKTIGKPAEPFLLKLLKSPDPAVRGSALAGLRKARGDDPTPGDEALAAVAGAFAVEGDAVTLKEAYDYLRAAGPRAEPCFLEGLRSPREPVRSLSIEGLRDLKSEKAVDAVGEIFLKDASEEVRRLACDFLKAQGAKAEGALVGGLSSGNPKVRLMAIPALGEIGSRKPLDHIARLFREERDAEVHRAAFDYLKGIGAPAEKELIHALSDPDKRIRLEAIRALGQAKSRAAIEPLIDFMTQLDPEMRKAAEEGMVLIGRPAVDAALKAVESGRLKRRSAEAILALYDQEEVERLLDALVTPEGGSGFFPGMFRGLASMGKERAVPVLLRMATERGHAWRLPAADGRERLGDWPLRMQELAVMALGELGDASAVAPLQEALRGVASAPGDDIQEEIVVALHRLGDGKPLDEFVARASSRAEAALKADNAHEACAALFQMGLVQNRAGRPKEAEETYLRVLRVAEERKVPAAEIECLPTVYYNLACLDALRGEKARGLERLRKAVEAGFRDRAWIRMDRDLDALRGEEGYARLLADDKLFERKPDE